MSTAIKEILALAWLMGMMFSPEALALQGNLTGHSGFGFYLPLAAAVVLHGLNSAASPWPDEIGRLRSTFGGPVTSLVLLTARPAVAVCLATATLVTAGFVFNEVFVYWFPNFGFAALLLAVLLALNLAGRRIAGAAQALFVSTALFGLAGLALAGSGVEPPGASTLTPGTGILQLESFGLGVIAFVGYDLLRYTAPDLDRRQAHLLMGIGILATGVLFGAWNTTALIHVAPSRLADSSIPHILAAKAVMGQTGRIVIGIVVIAGACAAVNLLFQAVAQMVAGMAANGLIPAMGGVSPSRPWLPLVGMAGLAGLLMAVGFAGSDWLDVSLRAGLVLWIISIGLAHLAPLIPVHGPRAKTAASRNVGAALVHLALFTTMTALGIILIMAHDEPIKLLHAILIMIAIAAGLAATGLAAARRPIGQPRNTSHPKEGVSQ